MQSGVRRVLNGKAVMKGGGRMSLQLPADVEPHLIDGVEWSDPGVYALKLNRPDDLAEAWDQTFDHRPDYWESLMDAHAVVYVGATKNVIGRLEDHRDGQKRLTALTSVCEIEGIRNIWWFDSATEAFDRENGLALTMQAQYPHTYVHSR